MEASKSSFLVEVNNIEKQLWTLIHTKGILHPDVSELYTKAGSTYEQIFKSNLQQEELQEVEFCLWKLHYKHIDEFRKGLKADDPAKSNTHMKAFKLFLLRAAEFYKNLISKVRGYYHKGLSEESGGKSRFLCHRFYICLGDLERYKEQYLKPHGHSDWSTAATYYLEAAKSWPDSGNPHNQLAVLATYVGDDFLALYHCVRSLAVKEPFPGASNNLLLLFEKNRSSSPLQSLSTDAVFNFLNPSERNVTVKAKGELKTGSDFWTLVVRTISFFFLKSSFDEFGCAFASTMRALDAVFAADDRNLEAMLESYQVMDSARKGPYRILQLVAVFVFIFHNLAEFNESDNVKEEVKLTNLALTMVFIIMGRVVERCLKTSPLDSCPLLPALLVFLDYLPFLLHKEEEEECRLEEKSEIAISYFFSKLVDLLNQLEVRGQNCSAKVMVALWEDHELRSLAPLAPIHQLLDFSTHMELRDRFDRGKELRLQRIVNSAIEITSRQKGSQKWLFFDKQGTRFYTTSGERQCKGEPSHRNGDGSNRKRVTIGKFEIIPCGNERPVPAEEEEVILLKPLVRCQSAPISSSSIATKPLSSDNTTSEYQTTSSDESLRRTSSLIVNHSQQDTNSGSFSFTQGLKNTDQHIEEGTVTGRPPSLSAWVVDKTKEKSKPNGLIPIDETGPVTSFDSLSISSSTEHPASLYSPPTPSAPLLPEDASWFHNGVTMNKADQTRYMEPPGFMKSYTNPPLVGLSSSEWLRRYRESQNLRPAYPYQAQGTNNLRNFLANGSPKFSLLAKYGTPNDQTLTPSENSMFYPQLYMEDHEPNGQNFSNGQQSTKEAYGFSDDPGPFLRYLREKELNENGQRLREPSPAYMNN